MRRRCRIFISFAVTVYLIGGQLSSVPVSYGSLLPGIPAPPVRILFDDAHGQSFGNADWTPRHAYSDLASDLESALDATVFSLSENAGGRLTPETLAAIDLLIIPEPNIRYTSDEIAAIRRFVSIGGALFLIADHGGSDRNFDGWDSCMIFNELTHDWGISFLGDTFSETPVRGRRANNSCIISSLRAIGAWAGTSIIVDPDSWHWIPIIASQKTGFPFLVTGDIGAGRVAAIGDSSAFDDGTGDTTKNRHSAYHSWMFEQRRLAITTTAWLLQRQPRFLPQSKPPFPERTRHDTRAIDTHGTRIIIDASMGNNDADGMERFGRSVEAAFSFPVLVNLDTLHGLRPRDILILTNPSAPIPVETLSSIAQWVQDGGRMIIAGASARNPLSNIPDLNALMSAMHASSRLNADQILDETSHTGKPWSLKIPLVNRRSEFTGVDSVVFWGSASVIDPDGHRQRDTESVTVLAWTSPHAISIVHPDFSVPDGIALPHDPIHPESAGVGTEPSLLPDYVSPRAIPVAVLERIGSGAVILMGANPFTDFQYPT
ncbi:hypothetical protein JXA80_11370, partial [bacterium]|nr:hypothetical protein [candidate division CSSED10-310 bacterium]